MITENRQNVKTENAVECQFGDAIRELKISSFLKASNVRKKKGGSVFDIFQFLVFTRYIILEWLRRKNNDQKTICELFYVYCDDIQDIELSTALKQLLKLLCDGLKNHTITITGEIKMQLINWFVSQPAFIKALYPKFMWEV